MRWNKIGISNSTWRKYKHMILDRKNNKRISPSQKRTVSVLFLLLTPFFIAMAVIALLISHFKPQASQGASRETVFGDTLSLTHTVIFLDENEEPFCEYIVRHGDHIPETPDHDFGGYIFVRWDFPSYANLSPEEYPIYEDMRIHPILLDQRLIALNGLAVSGMDASEIDTDMLRMQINEIKTEADKK